MRTRARKTTYQVSGLNSDAAAARVEAALHVLPYVDRFVIDLVRESVTVTHRPDQTAADLVQRALIAAGFARVVKG